MKIPIPLSVVLVAAVVTLVAFALLHSLAARSEQHVRDLQAALDVQTDVVAPFLQRFHLGSGAAAKGNDFRAFLDEAVSAGKVPAGDVTAFLATLAAARQGDPVLTPRGWVMPVIAQGD